MTMPQQLNRSHRQAFGVGLVALALAGCAQTPDNLFILLEEPNGRPSSIVIQNEQGAQVLDQPGQASGMDDAGAAPVAPLEVQPKIVDAIFRRTFAATPPKPKTFILYFNSGSSELTKGSVRKLPWILDTVKHWPNPTIDSIGHTDREGGAAANARLALGRANAVRDILVENDVDLDMIEVSSHGESNPLIPTADGVREPRNRRVEVVVR